MSKSLKNILGSVFIDPFVTFYHTMQILKDLQKSASSFSYTSLEKEELMSRIQQRAADQILDGIELYSDGFIKKKFHSEIQDQLNRAIVKQAGDPSYPKLKKKLEGLLDGHVENLDASVIQSETKAMIQKVLNEKMAELASNDGNRLIEDKVEELLENHVQKIGSEVLQEKTKEKIKDHLNLVGLDWAKQKDNAEVLNKAKQVFISHLNELDASVIEESTKSTIEELLNQTILAVTCDEENEKVRQKSEQLSGQLIHDFENDKITKSTHSSIEEHLNQEVLKESKNPENEQVQLKLQQLLASILSSYDTKVVDAVTKSRIEEAVNKRIQIILEKDEKGLLSERSVALLRGYLEEHQIGQIVDLDSLTQIKKKLNNMVLELVEASKIIDEEANRVFTEILQRANPGNIDPVVRMQVEASLYRVIVKEMDAYGKPEIIKKAIEIIQGLSKELPHESTANDLLMQHKTK